MESGGEGTTGRSLALLLLHSAAMFSLPFVAFFGVRGRSGAADAFVDMCWAVGAAVATAQLVLASFCFVAYRDTQAEERARKLQ
jgi:VMA21-like domain